MMRIQADFPARLLQPRRIVLCALCAPFNRFALFTHFTLFTLSALGVPHAATYYVAPDGNNNASGTLAQPWASLQKANEMARPGDTVLIRGGAYRITTPYNSGAGIALTRSGESDQKRIYYWAYPGETPVFDFSGLRISTTGYTSGFSVSGSWLHLKGFEVTGVPMNTRSNTGMTVSDSHDNIFELLRFHHNKGSGFFIHTGTGGHLILNCDSHDNYDPDSHQGNGQNADGFGVHYQTTGKPTTFIGCRAWWNSDDGWDYISQEVPVITENCWAMGNGYINSGAGRAPDGNGAGFKMGSSKTGIRHIIRYCVAWKNKNQGFYANHSSGGNTWYNNTSYNNGVQYDMLASTWDAQGNRTDGVLLAGNKKHIMRNNIAFPNATRNMQGVDAASNSWDLNLVPAESDFMSVSDEGFRGPRRPDGSLPDLPFMKLRAGSRLADRGAGVGLPFEGTAPDLGAYEIRAVTGIPLQAPGAQDFSLLRLGDFYTLEFPEAGRLRGAEVELFQVQGRKVLALPLDRGRARWHASRLPSEPLVLRISSAGGSRILGRIPAQIPGR